MRPEKPNERAEFRSFATMLTMASVVWIVADATDWWPAAGQCALFIAAWWLSR